jgi:hypothetical protein
MEGPFERQQVDTDLDGVETSKIVLTKKGQTKRYIEIFVKALVVVDFSKIQLPLESVQTGTAKLPSNSREAGNIAREYLFGLAGLLVAAFVTIPFRREIYQWFSDIPAWTWTILVLVILAVVPIVWIIWFNSRARFKRATLTTHNMASYFVFEWNTLEPLFKKYGVKTMVDFAEAVGWNGRGVFLEGVPEIKGFIDKFGVKPVGFKPFVEIAQYSGPITKFVFMGLQVMQERINSLDGLKAYARALYEIFRVSEHQEANILAALRDQKVLITQYGFQHKAVLIAALQEFVRGMPGPFTYIDNDIPSQPANRKNEQGERKARIERLIRALEEADFSGIQFPSEELKPMPTLTDAHPSEMGTSTVELAFWAAGFGVAGFVLMGWPAIVSHLWAARLVNVTALVAVTSFILRLWKDHKTSPPIISEIESAA